MCCCWTVWSMVGQWLFSLVVFNVYHDHERMIHLEGSRHSSTRAQRKKTTRSELGMVMLCGHVENDCYKVQSESDQETGGLSHIVRPTLLPGYHSWHRYAETPCSLNLQHGLYLPDLRRNHVEQKLKDPLKPLHSCSSTRLSCSAVLSS